MNPNTHRLMTLVRPSGVGAAPCRGGKGVSCARNRICTALSARAPRWGRAYLSDATWLFEQRFTGSASRVPSRSLWQMEGVDRADLPVSSLWTTPGAPLRRGAFSAKFSADPTLIFCRVSAAKPLSKPRPCQASVLKVPSLRDCHPVPPTPRSTPTASIGRSVVALSRYHLPGGPVAEVLQWSALPSCEAT